jgi:hypothetical protein
MRELSSAPEGHLFELLVLPGAERRGERLQLSGAVYRVGFRVEPVVTQPAPPQSRT